MARNSWRETTVGVLCGEGILHTQTGPFGSQLHSYDYVARGVPVVPTEGIGRRRLLTESIPEVSEETATRLSRHRLKSGDILFARRGVQATGLSAIVTPKQEGWLCGTGAILLRVTGKGIDPKFLSFFLSTEETVLWLKQHAVGAVMPNLNEGVIRQIPVTLPPLAEQKAIAEVLGALDDKIELNRRMNATLEAMARALFQSWFVDFDPVRAKLDGRQPTGLDPATAALFPDHLQRSDDSLRPRGWQMSRLGDHVELVRGNTYKSKLKDHPGPFLLGLNSIQRNGGFRDDSLRTYGGESAQKLILRPGDLFASLKDVTQAADLLGAVARVPAEIAAGRLTQDTVKLVPLGSGISYSYLYHALLRPEYREYCRARATGTTNLGLSREDFLNYTVLLPPANIQQTFDHLESQLDARIATNRTQSRTLAALRDTLLPKLLNGEVSITQNPRS